MLSARFPRSFREKKYSGAPDATICCETTFSANIPWLNSKSSNRRCLWTSSAVRLFVEKAYGETASGVHGECRPGERRCANAKPNCIAQYAADSTSKEHPKKVHPFIPYGDPFRPAVIGRFDRALSLQR